MPAVGVGEAGMLFPADVFEMGGGDITCSMSLAASCYGEFCGTDAAGWRA